MADRVVNNVDQSEAKDNSSRPVSSEKQEIDEGGKEESNFRETVLSKLETMTAENTTRLQNSLKVAFESPDSVAKESTAHTFGPLTAREMSMPEIISHLEDLILYDDNNDIVKHRASLRYLSDVDNLALMSHSLAAFVATLNPSHLRKMSTRIVSDIGLWISRLFRFFESSAYFHEDPREGLVRICRMNLHNRYTKYAAEGYEALYSRPPVIYISAAAKSGLGQYLCTQLGLPLSSLSIIPCNTVFGSNFKMDIAALENVIQDDLAAQKIPLIIIANAGTPIVGHVDNLQRLQEICKANHIWLHVEGHSLAALCLVSTPNLPAKICDSLTLPLGTWLGIAAIPFTTMFKTLEPVTMHAAGLTYNVHTRLTCLPLWVCLQRLGSDGVMKCIRVAFELSKYMQEHLSSISNIKLLGKQREELENGATMSDVITKPISTNLLLDSLSPTVVFQYIGPENDATQTGEREKSHLLRNLPYYDNLNSWLGQILQRDIPKVHLDIVDLDNFGVCVRFCPIETAQVAGTTKEDINEFIDFLLQQVAILNATVKHKETFRSLAEANTNLQMVEITNWAGLGGLRYLPNHWLQSGSDLPDCAKEDINRLNRELVMQLKATDSAFSLGEGEDGLACVRFGMVTEETDMEELINLVFNVGKEVEESSKYLESMAEIIKKGIETASEDLKKENQEKIWQEGILRQVPVVATFVNWWYPLPKETGIKGRSFNLHSGVIESTENIYRYHMQIQEGSPKVSPPTPRPSVQTPVRVTPQHSRSSSKSSVSSKQGGGSTVTPEKPNSSDDTPMASPAPPPSPSLATVATAGASETERNSDVQ